MTPCTHARGLLAAHLDGALDPPSARGVEDHLATCPRCRTLTWELAQVDLWLRSSPAPSPTPDQTEALVARLGDALDSERPSPAGPPSPAPLPRPAVPPPSAAAPLPRPPLPPPGWRATLGLAATITVLVCLAVALSPRPGEVRPPSRAITRHDPQRPREATPHPRPTLPPVPAAAKALEDLEGDARLLANAIDRLGRSVDQFVEQARRDAHEGTSRFATARRMDPWNEP